MTGRKQYRGNVGQAEQERRVKGRERPLKIGKDRRLEAYIRIKLVETWYEYIERGIFWGISNKDLWEKSKQKRRRYKPVVGVSRNNRVCRSIEQRPEAVGDRGEVWSWGG